MSLFFYSFVFYRVAQSNRKVMKIDIFDFPDQPAKTMKTIPSPNILPPRVTQTPHEFLESTLGFGPPVANASLANLLDNSPALHFGARNGQSRASLNAMTHGQWDSNHFSEAGFVLHDILFQSMNRIGEFLKKEMAKMGFSVDLNHINPQVHEKFMQVMRLTMGYHNKYVQHVASGTKILSSVTFRKHDDTINFDMLLRVVMFIPVSENAAEDESMYFEFNFPAMIKNIALLIHEDQVNNAANMVQSHLYGFGTHSEPFYELPGLELSRVIMHAVIQNQAETAVAIYTHYRDRVLLNGKYFRNRNDEVQTSKVVPWDDLTKPQRIILIHAVEMARVQIKGFIAFNMEAANS